MSYINLENVALQKQSNQLASGNGDNHQEQDKLRIGIDNCQGFLSDHSGQPVSLQHFDLE